jgi:hypothetical protein
LIYFPWLAERSYLLASSFREFLSETKHPLVES